MINNDGDVIKNMTIPVSGIPKGFKVSEIRPAKAGDIVVSNADCGFHEASEGYNHPQSRIILKKLYDPNVNVPNGWLVYKDADGDWIACDPICYKRIRGLQHIVGFNAPPTELSHKVERQCHEVERQ